MNVVLNDLDLNFEGQTFQLAIVTSIDWKMQALPLAVRYLPSNGTTANVVHHDCVHFQGHELLKVNILQTVRDSEKCSSMAIIEVDIWHRMVTLRTLYYVILTFIFKVRHFLLINFL